MSYAELMTGVRLYYEDAGAGRPVVLLHGRLGTARADCGAMIDWLSEDYRVIGPSLRGYGESRPPQRDYPADFYQRDARDVLALLDALALPRAHLIGYSDGGEVALIAAGMAPERFVSVAVWGAVGYYGPEMRPVLQRSYPADYLTPDDLERNGLDKGSADALMLQWIRACKTIIDSGGDLSLSLAPRITVPLLLMLGQRDTLNPESYGRRFVDAAPDGQLVMFDAGHAIQDDQPEQFRRVVTAFLKRAQGEA